MARTTMTMFGFALSLLGGALAAGCAMASGDGDGSTGVGGAPTTSGAGALAGSTSDGGGAVCGDGVKDGDEDCDGADFGRSSCASYGFGLGDLACTDACFVVLTGCAPPEDCGNTVDDDLDGDVDCDDADCADAAACLDPCGQAVELSFPDSRYGVMAGAADGISTSCGSGPERVFRFTAPFTWDVQARVVSDGQVALAVTTGCGETDAELGCDASFVAAWQDRKLPFTMEAGTTYFITVEAAGATGGSEFYVNVTYPSGPEAHCVDLLDGDQDGLVDCDDPDHCQSHPLCVPGSGSYGSACSANTDCSANANDPVCLPPSLGFPAGYCSEFCNLAAPDCSGDGLCHALGISQNGVCLDACSDDGECGVGMVCRDLGLASHVCFRPPETGSLLCNNLADDDFDGLTDCEDPSCHEGSTCSPGPGAVGTLCTAHNQCQSTAGVDPFCPNGYCSELCDLAADDCPVGSLCSFSGLISGTGACFVTCTDDADCPPTLSCVDHGYGLHCNL